MYLIPSHPSFLVLAVSARQSFLVLLFLFTKPFSHLRQLPVLSPLLLFLVFLFYFFSPNLFLSPLLLLTNPISLFFSFPIILSSPLAIPFLCALIPGSTILSCAAIASQPSFLRLLFLLTSPFSISHSSHRSPFSLFYLFSPMQLHI
jgi:hypothetical protein